MSSILDHFPTNLTSQMSSTSFNTILPPDGLLPHIDWQTLAILAPAAFVLVHFAPWLYDPHGIRKYPGPWLAKFSDIWLGSVSKEGHRSEVVHEMHQKYGPIVRIAPNHVSIADPDALPILYAHGNGALKSPFYDAFVSIRRGIFNTRDRNEHTRKRKIIAHIFSQKSVTEFEPHIKLHVSAAIRQWDRLCGLSKKLGKNASGPEGEGWHGSDDGWVWMDVLPWMNYIAFDIVGDLAFGAPFGMIEAAKDMAQVPLDQTQALNSYDGSQKAQVQSKEIPAVKILNGRGEYSMSMGVLPAYWRPIARLHPWYRQGGEDVKTLAGIAIMAVKKRLEMEQRWKEMGIGGKEGLGRVDLLSKLQEGKDADGNRMGREELTAEALTLLIAGSDTTSNSTCAIIYHLANTPHALRKLHAELDAELGTEDELVCTYDQLKRLTYLEACCFEGLRIHSTSALGLPRIVPEGGLTIADGTQVKGAHYFPAGTVLSVPSYTIHRDTKVWGDDVETFRPERWIDADADQKALMMRTFNPFSIGPRACVGRNLAMLELQVIIASLLRRYDYKLEHPGEQLETREGFLRKPLGCRVGIRKREF